MSEYKQELAAEMIEAFNNIGSRVDISEPEECEAIFDLIESKGYAIVPRETVDALQQRVGELERERNRFKHVATVNGGLHKTAEADCERLQMQLDACQNNAAVEAEEALNRLAVAQQRVGELEAEQGGWEGSAAKSWNELREAQKRIVELEAHRDMYKQAFTELDMAVHPQTRSLAAALGERAELRAKLAEVVKALTDIDEGLRRNWTNEPNNQRKIAYVAALGVVENATKDIKP